MEISGNSKGNMVLTIHTGSRYLGATVAGIYQKIANEKYKKSDFGKLVAELKQQGRETEIEAELNRLRAENLKFRGVDMYLEGEEMENYLHDLNLAQIYAQENRESIAETILTGLNLTVKNRFDTIHNYIDMDRKILRKGAVSAAKGERLIIPINMRDGSIIAIGKGNEDWNYSAPHGAGRVLSRRKAKEQLDLTAFQETMKDVWSTSVVADTLDEAPGAYKSLESILGNIKDTVEVVEVIRPLYNFKGVDELKPWQKGK